MKIRENYMGMTMEVRPGVFEKMFPHIDEHTTAQVFQNKAGLLFSTEFAQPALTIMERAQYVYLKSKGLLNENSLFAGHSLGEYSALATIGDIMPFEKLLSVVVYRGLTMQAAVDRDASGRSRFAMVAFNPSRLGKAFSQKYLTLLVDLIRSETKGLIEIVNYNIEGQQYVCAGDLIALTVLADTTSYIAKKTAEMLASAESSFPLLVAKSAAKVAKMPQPIRLSRGVATIPLEGIDVPFHSSFLMPRLDAFRNILLKNVMVENIDPQKLLGKYVSNVMGTPFEISREYFEKASSITGSVVLERVLKEWNE
jgi:fatty acid synthase subunit beta